MKKIAMWCWQTTQAAEQAHGKGRAPEGGQHGEEAHLGDACAAQLPGEDAGPDEEQGQDLEHCRHTDSSSGAARAGCRALGTGDEGRRDAAQSVGSLSHRARGRPTCLEPLEADEVGCADLGCQVAKGEPSLRTACSVSPELQ